MTIAQLINDSPVLFTVLWVYFCYCIKESGKIKIEVNTKGKLESDE